MFFHTICNGGEKWRLRLGFGLDMNSTHNKFNQVNCNWPSLVCEKSNLLSVIFKIIYLQFVYLDHNRTVINYDRSNKCLYIILPNSTIRPLFKLAIYWAIVWPLWHIYLRKISWTALMFHDMYLHPYKTMGYNGASIPYLQLLTLGHAWVIISHIQNIDIITYPCPSIIYPALVKRAIMVPTGDGYGVYYLWTNNIWLRMKHAFPTCIYPDNKFHGANMGSTWILSSPGGLHVGTMNLAISVRCVLIKSYLWFW